MHECESDSLFSIDPESETLVFQSQWQSLRDFEENREVQVHRTRRRGNYEVRFLDIPRRAALRLRSMDVESTESSNFCRGFMESDGECTRLSGE